MKIRKRYITLSVVVVVLASILFLIQYYHFTGLESSLERLVNEKTKGAYKLDLGKTTYDFLRLDFTLKDARIYRIDTLNQKRMYSVELPEVIINLGSIKSYFSFGQIYVKEFIVKEPLVVLQKENAKKQRLSLSTELAHLLRIIKEVLDSFNIRSFKIIKGSFDISKGDQALKVGLIDFMAQEWNVRKLTRQSQIKIDIGGQELNIFKHSFKFSQIEYSYLKRQLKISDFRYHHHDTITGVNIQADGDALVIDHMDWEKLYSTDRYKFKKIELTGVEFKGSFPAAASRKNRKRKGVNFSRVVYETLGEFYIDSLLVKDANVYLSYKRKEDSTSISLQRASFSLLDLRMLGTSESFEVGQVRCSLNKTSLAFGKDYLIKFDSLLYNANQSAHRRPQWIVEGVEVTDKSINKNFLQCGQVRVTDFDPFDFFLHKKLKAESIELRNVMLDIPPERFKARKKTQEKAPPDIDVDRFTVHNAAISYNDLSKRTRVLGLNLSVQSIHIKKNEKPLYSFEWLDLRELTYEDSTRENTVVALEMYADTKKILSKAAVVKQKGKLSFQFNTIKALYSYDSLLKGLPLNVSLIHASKLSINGNYNKGSGKTKIPSLLIGRISMDTLHVNVNTAKAVGKLNAYDFNLSEIKADSVGVTWDHVTTRLSSFSWKDSLSLITGKAATINSHSSSKLNDLLFIQKDSSVIIHAESLSLSSFKEDPFFAQVSLLHPDISIKRDNIIIRSALDSIALRDVKTTNPFTRKITIYHPVTSLTINKSQRKEENKSGFDLSEITEEILVEHAQLDLTANQSYYTIYDLSAHWKKGASYNYTIDSATTEGKHFTYSLKRIHYQPNQFDIGAVHITPLESIREYSASGFERDWFKINLQQVQVKGLLIDSLLANKEIKMDEVTIGNFRLDNMRDKRLPDPPFKEKPLLAKRFHAFKRKIDIPMIHIKNGAINVMLISEKTEDMATLELDHIAGDIKNFHSAPGSDQNMQINVAAQVDGNGSIKLDYEVKDNGFKINADISDLDLSAFNSMVQPLLSVRFKSGRLNSLKVKAEATNTSATGTAVINYQDLHVEILKKERAALGNEVLSVLANQLIRNNRRNTHAPLVQERDLGRSEFNYWVKIVLKGAAEAARHGKKQRFK